MNKIIAFKKLTNLLFGSETFTDAKLADGTLITYVGELKIDTEIYTILEDGTTVLVEDMEYEMEDGTKFTTVDGKVTEIIPMVEETPIEETPIETPEEIIVEPITLETLSMAITDLMKRVEALEMEEMTEDIVEDPMVEDMKKIKEDMASVMTLVTKIVEKPAPSTIEIKNNFSKKINNSKKDEIDRIISEINRNK
jgi:hypothetical protein